MLSNTNLWDLKSANIGDVNSKLLPHHLHVCLLEVGFGGLPSCEIASGPAATPSRPPIGCLVSCPCCAMPVQTWSALDQVWGAPWSTKQGCKLEQNALFPDKLPNETRGDWWRFNMCFLVNCSWKSKFRIIWQIEPHFVLLTFLQMLFFGMGAPTPLDSPTEREHAWPCWFDLLRIPNRFGSKNSQIPVLPGHVLHASLLPKVWLQQTASHCSEGLESVTAIRKGGEMSCSDMMQQDTHSHPHCDGMTWVENHHCWMTCKDYRSRFRVTMCRLIAAGVHFLNWMSWPPNSKASSQPLAAFLASWIAALARQEKEETWGPDLMQLHIAVFDLLKAIVGPKHIREYICQTPLLGCYCNIVLVVVILNEHKWNEHTITSKTLSPRSEAGVEADEVGLSRLNWAACTVVNSSILM